MCVCVLEFSILLWFDFNLDIDLFHGLFRADGGRQIE